MRPLTTLVLATLLASAPTAFAARAKPPKPSAEPVAPVPKGAPQVPGGLTPLPQDPGMTPEALQDAVGRAAPGPQLSDEADFGLPAPELEPAETEPMTPFVKGTLAHVGDLDFYVPRNQVWIGSQYFYTTDRLDDGRIHRTHYMGLAPRLTVRRGDLFASFEVPLAVEIYDYVGDPSNPDAAPGGEEFAGAGTFATFLWDEPSEYAQVIRYIRYGSKEEPLYVNVSRVSAATLGHGTVMRTYNANLDQGRRYVGAEVDWAHDYGGVEFATSNIIGNDLLGFLAFGRPGAWLAPENLYARTASLGFSVVADRHAPLTLVRDADGALVADAVSLPQVSEALVVPVLGVDGEVKVYKGRHMDVKTYADLSHLAVDGGDSGLSVGALGRFNLGDRDGKARHAFRTRAEVQLYGSHYDPGYYDLFYEVQKYQAVLRPDAERQTKLGYVLGREEGLQRGTRLEASYALVDRLAVGAGIEQGTAGDSNAFIHVEVPSPKRVRLMATAAKVNFDGVGELLAPGGGNGLLIARSEVRPVQWMMIGAEVSRLYRMTDLDGAARPAPGAAGDYAPGLWWGFDLSIGYEF